MTDVTYAPERGEALAGAWQAMSRRAEELAASTDPSIRPPERGVELLPVTKFFPASDVAALYDAGARAVGENRDQEAAGKVAELDGYGAEPLAWHYIGQLQTNKAKSVAKYARCVHSVDRASLVRALSAGYRRAVDRFEGGDGPRPAAHAAGGLECLIQVNLDAEAETPGQAAEGMRGGAAPGQVRELAEAIAAADGLALGGVMGVAPLGEDPERAFAALWEISQGLQEEFPEAVRISAGMSADLEEAIRWGSTLVRVGSAIMGDRPAR